MSNQSSVEWLQWALEHTILTHEQTMQTIGLFEQAKAMHKEEIDKVAGDFWNEGASYVSDGQRKYNSFEQYYNETFGGNNEQQ